MTGAAPTPGREGPVTAADTAPANRLARATSPYLLQHAHNPVDWHEWGPEALELARVTDRPIFLSVGYSACHWCHVMAHESFEDAQVAAVMNRLFVNIKVDREERPDLDEIYMQATMLLNQGQGGWPMSVWLTPEGQPFFAGTYFPPRARWGRPGFVEICERIGELWGTHRAALLSDARRLSEHVAHTLTSAGDGGDTITLAHIDRIVDLLAGAFDPNHGGTVSGGTNKFPPSLAMQLMLRSAHRRRGEEPRRRRLVERVETTLHHMLRGGIYDHLAGGVARYSTDLEWHVPHFEKMLYDQALVSGACLDAYLYARHPQFAQAAREICDYVLSDLTAPQGAFYSARDADSEGQEGRYYVWTRREIVEALGPEDAELFCSYYDVSETGNWHDPHEPGAAKNVLRVLRDAEAVARLHRIDLAELTPRLADARQRLLERRARRPAPARDEKILCEWNGLMIAALARGGAVLDAPAYVAAAARAADFVLARQCRNGRLLRSYRDGRVLETAFLGDYACLIGGLLDLYEATFERRWLDRAVELNRAAMRHYADRESGGFFFTADDHERLLARSKDVRDGAIPAGNSVQLMNLLRLAAMLDDGALREFAERTIQVFAADVLARPGAGERFLQAVEFARAGPVEIALIGRADQPETQALLRAVHETYVPNRVLMLLDPQQPGEAPRSPLLENRPQVGQLPTAYVCRGYACRAPVTTADALRAALAR